MKHTCLHDDQLKQVGLRATQDRHDLLELFAQPRAWCVSQIAAVYPKKDLSTIYRNIQKFLDAGIIRSIHMHSQEEYYEQVLDGHHDHTACPACQLLTCVPCPIQELNQSHLLEIEKLCHDCL